jgi:hypothetical protein
LRIRNAGSGDQGDRRDRNQKPISHLNVSSRVCIARADNERRWTMFRGIRGSSDFVF